MDLSCRVSSEVFTDAFHVLLGTLRVEQSLVVVVNPVLLAAVQQASGRFLKPLVSLLLELLVPPHSLIELLLRFTPREVQRTGAEAPRTT